VRRRVLRIVVLAPAVATSVFALAPLVEAHPKSGQQHGFIATVSAIDPNVLGVRASVLGGDDRLLVQNLSGETVVIFGYEGEPFLRFGRAGVFRNVHSPTTYLSRDRSNDTAAPAVADVSLPPLWKRVAGSSSFAWHDRRIRWTKGALPSSVRDEPDRAHRLFDWRVPGTAGGDRFAIVGFLGYAPGADAATGDAQPGWAVRVAFVLGVTALGALGALEWVRRRR
jgi:hypothetical protein